jgi:hypothetical protein
MADLLGPWLQREYSQALYGARELVDVAQLKVLWLALLPPPALARVARVGACPLHSRHPSLPFYFPHHVPMNGVHSHDPVDTLWIGRHVGKSRAVPAPNHTWIEVTHCSSGIFNVAANDTAPAGIIDGVTFRRSIGPAWLYAAPGSGVVINVGRTVVLSKAHATRLIDELVPPAHSRGCVGQATPSLRHHNGSLKRLPDERQRLARAAAGPARAVHDGLVGSSEAHGLDSIQIVSHKEWYSAELRHEVILLHERECADMSTMSNVRCGLPPDKLSDQSSSRCRAALKRMAACHEPRKLSYNIERKLGGVSRFKVRTTLVWTSSDPQSCSFAYHTTQCTKCRSRTLPGRLHSHAVCAASRESQARCSQGQEHQQGQRQRHRQAVGLT